MLRRSLVTATLAASVAAAAAATALTSSAPAQAAPSPKLDIEKTKLSNGLELILHEDKRTPIVTVNLWYHVGSKDEPPGKNGFAHLFEHVMFQGSKHVPEDHYFKYLERIGASDVNGTTNTDRTNYFETVPRTRLEQVLWMESDRMGFLLAHADKATFESQREVVKNERRQNYENAPYGLVRQFIHESVYPAGHPYRLLTIGTPKDLDAASFQDVTNFFKTWYVPNNATLVIAGDIDKARAKELAEKYFGPIPARPIPTRTAPEPVQLTGTTTLEVEANVELPRVYITWPTPKMFAQGDAELDLVAKVLATGKTSRLYKRLVYDMQIAQDVGASQESGYLASLFNVVATAQPGHTPAELLKVIDEEIEKLRTGGLQGTELQRAKTSYSSQMFFELERNSSRANAFNSYNQMAGRPDFFADDMARYEKASDAGTLEALKQYLPAGRRVVTLVTPSKSAPLAGVLKKSSAGGGK